MKTEGGIYISDYLVFTFDGGDDVVAFDNHEVVGDALYIPPFAPEMFEAASGKVTSRKKPQREYLEFQLKYKTASTRNKWEKIRKHIRDGYVLEFSCAHAVTPFDSFPYDTATAGDSFQKTEILFGAATVEIPPDFAFDRIARGIGAVKIEEVPIRVYRSVNLPLPATSCDIISLSDFIYNQWQVSGANNEILQVDIELSPSGNISSIDSYGAATVVGSGVISPGSSGFMMSWNGSEYVPDTGPEYLNGTYTFTAELGVTTSADDPCSITFVQTLVFEANQPPVATDVLITGDPIQGELLTGSETITDLEGDTIDMTPTDSRQWYRWSSLADALTEDTGLATFLTSGSTYTLQSGDVGKYISYRVKPYALTGGSPGTPVFSSPVGPIAPDTFYTFRIATFTGATFNNTSNAALTFGVDWGDGAIVTSSVGSATSFGATRNYPSVPAIGYYDVKVYVDPTKIVGVTLFNQDILLLDMSSLTHLQNISLSTLPNLASFSLPASPVNAINSLNINSMSSLTSIDISAYTGIPVTSNIFFNSALTSVSWPTVGATVCASFRFDGNTSYTSGLDMTGHDIGGIINMSSTPATSFVVTVSTTAVSNIYMFSMNITGVLDLTVFNITGNAWFSTNPNLTGVTLAANTITSFYINVTGITNFDASTLTSCTKFRLNTGGLLTLTPPTTSAAINDWRTTNSPALALYNVNSLTFAGNVDFRADGHNWSTNDTNLMLNNLLAALPNPGTGSIDLTDNSPPDNSGISGLVIAAQLASNGYTVTHD